MDVVYQNKRLTRARVARFTSEYGDVIDRFREPKNIGKLSESERVRERRGSEACGCTMGLQTMAVDRQNPSGP